MLIAGYFESESLNLLAHGLVHNCELSGLPGEALPLSLVLHAVALWLTKQKAVSWAEGAFFLQVVPGRAGGGSFRRKKTYIAKKEFAYRICASRPTSAMPKPFLCCERAFCCSMVVMCRGGDLTCFDVMRSVAG